MPDPGPQVEATHLHRPRFSAPAAEQLADEHFGVRGRAAELPSERDQNFKIEGAGGACVLKIAQAREDRAVLELQNAALEAAGRAAPERVPRIRRAHSGETLVRVAALDGRHHWVRLLTWLPGVPLADVRPHSPALLEDLGRTLGRIDRELAGLDPTAADRELKWDLRRGPDVVAAYATDVPASAAADRALLERLLARFRERRPSWDAELSQSVIHNDANDHNVLVRDDLDGQAVLGLIDFGDMVRSYTLGEVAIASAYAMLGKRDPLAAAARILAGYSAEHALPERELEHLFDLCRLRLATSVAISARQKRLEPENTYLAVSEAPAWALLRVLDAVPDGLALAIFREACGFEPCARHAAVVDWLQQQRAGIAPVLGFELTHANARALDLGLDSPAAQDADPAGGRWHDHLAEMRRAHGVRVLFGGWDEPRVCYAGELFGHATEDRTEGRTIHLGVDLFVDAGTPVCAPLDGVVHGRADNAGAGDYGPTVVLRHAPAAGVEFFTLYGHLERASLSDLVPGQSVARGQRIGRIGAEAENGGWPPHLHLQLVADALGCESDFPGVAPPSQRRVWTSLCPDAHLLLGRGPKRRARLGANEILALRQRHVGPSLSISYRRPLTIVRGRGTTLWDAEGRAFLDAVNNVPHVGHAHPRVVAAACEQMALLNTNTRYLHELLARYSERLAALLPDPLEVCYFTCSGSEAGELALRLARTHADPKGEDRDRARDVIVVQGGYHGNTGGLVELSSYKYAGPGGFAPPEHVHETPLPDPYRGLYREDHPRAGERYAEHVREAVERMAASGRRPAAFLVESLFGCGGQVVPPPGYLSAAYEHVRAAGGLCIADEVQTGFGRVGTHFWAFETQGVVPDIVTLGKPIGNGHPLGAVVTTRAIADSFANGMEWFNTFGGNPVSCAVGLAVLDVIEDESLQENARTIGALFARELAALAERHALIGDVRGAGLFLGIELVEDRAARTPAPRAAARIVERMRDRGVLISTDGPDHNVLKIKPPLVFGEADARRLVAALDEALGETGLGRG